MAISIQDLLNYLILLLDGRGNVVRQVGIGYPCVIGKAAVWELTENFDPTKKYKFDPIFDEWDGALSRLLFRCRISSHTAEKIKLFRLHSFFPNCTNKVFSPLL